MRKKIPEPHVGESDVERIQGEFKRRMAVVDEYSGQIKEKMALGQYGSAIYTGNKIIAAVKQCQADARVLTRKYGEGKEFPKYAKLGGSELRHTGKGQYWRDAGLWGVNTAFRDGKHVVITRSGPMAHAKGKELVEITEEEWRNGNKGYIDGTLRTPYPNDYDEVDDESIDDIPF